MKKLPLIVALSLGLVPALSRANGVTCHITQALHPLVLVGTNTNFIAVCRNNTKNRNYTDFHVISLDQPGLFNVTTTCADQKLPVGGSCTIMGGFSPLSDSNNHFTLGLHYGGTDYPKYTSLKFSTVVKGITSLVLTGGPGGGDIPAFAVIPGTGTPSLSYILGVNSDTTQSDIYLFDGPLSFRTRFPLSTVTTASFKSTNILAADSLGNLYAATTTSDDSTAGDGVSFFNYLTGKWSRTAFHAGSMGDAIYLVTNSLDTAFAVTQTTVGNNTEVWEYDTTSNTWSNTNFPYATAGNLVAFSPNNISTYLIADLTGNLYGLTAGINGTSLPDIWQFIPNPSTPGGTWVSTTFATTTSATPLSIFSSSNGNLYATGVNGGTYDLWTTPANSFAWTSTNFQAQTGAFEPPYPSFITDSTGNIYTTGLLGSGRIEIWSLASGSSATWLPLGFSGVSNSGSLSLQTTDTTNRLYLNSVDSLGLAEIWIYDGITLPTWTNTNFPSTSNMTQVLSLLTNSGISTPNVYATMSNGLYAYNGSAWSENNAGFTALTTRFVINTNGAVSTLNARQTSIPSSGECSTDPNYNTVWSDFAINDGFIDVLQYPLANAWASTNFPAGTLNYLYSPLVAVNNDIYALGISQSGTVYNIWHYKDGWAPTGFPGSAGSVYYCAQNALTPDSSSNLYVINNNLGTYGVMMYNVSTQTWNSVSSGLNGGVIRQLTADRNDNLYSILVNDIYFYNHLSQTWSTTHFNYVLNGNPQHLHVDKQNNLYAVAGPVPNTDIWEYAAATQTWGLTSLGFPSAQAGTIAGDFVSDYLGNLFVRTVNGNVQSVWEYSAGTWRNLALLSGFPTHAIINELASDASGNIYIATSKGLYLYAGVDWTLLVDAYVTRALDNNAGTFYVVTNNQGVLAGSLG